MLLVASMIDNNVVGELRLELEIDINSVRNQYDNHPVTSGSVGE